MRMASRLGFLFFSMGSWPSHALPSATVFLLEIRNDFQTIRSCSATLLKDNEGRCRLLTNAHCVHNGNSKTQKMLLRRGTGLGVVDVFHEEFGLFHGNPRNGEALESPTSLKSISLRYDLAELSLDKFLEKSCENELGTFDRVKKDSLYLGDYQHPLAALGFLKGQEQASTPQEISWRSGYGNASVFPYQLYNSDPLTTLYEVHHLRVMPGMSGGVLLNYAREPVGLLARLIPFQDTAFAIPMETVDTFLSGPPTADDPVKLLPRLALGHIKSSARTMTSSFEPRGAGDGLHGGGGDGLHAAGGDGLHGGGGDGLHGGGGDGLHAGGGKSYLDSRLKGDWTVFFEPDEGIVNEASQVILGTREFQIDGWDDFLNYGQNSNSKWITRAQDAYPDLEIRKDLFKRLDGYYRWDNRFGRQRRLVYVKDLGSNLGWSPVLTARPMVFFDIDSRKNRLGISIATHPLSEFGGPGSFQVDANAYGFSVMLNQEKKSIHLSALNVDLNCDNRHYRKLICNGNDFHLALSLINEKIPALRYRMALRRFIELQGRQVESVDFHFGTAQAVSDKSGMRRAFSGKKGYFPWKD